MKKTCYHLFFILLLLTPLVSWSQATENLSTLDPAYYDLDHLIAHGLVNDTIYSHRPWSRKEIARIIHVAQINWEQREKKGRITEKVLHRLNKRFHEDMIRAGYLEGENHKIILRPVKTLRFELMGLDSPYRAIPVNNGVQTIQGTTNPLVEFNEGRSYIDGMQYAYETTHEAFLTQYLYLYVHPRFQVEFPKNNQFDDVNAYMHKLYMKSSYKNFEIEMGRDSIVWGQLPEGGLLASTNARPMDMIKLTSSAPFTFPSILKYLGPSKFTFILANLGPDQNFPYTYMNGFKMSIKPHRLVELNIGHTMLLGGDGAPDLKWYNPITEFFLVRSDGLRGEGTNVVDHRIGGDISVLIPPLKNITAFLEVAWDDFGRANFIANFTDVMSFVAGFKTPYLKELWGMSLYGYFERMAPILYGHGVWTTGYTMNNNIIGLPPGADSRILAFKLIKKIEPYHFSLLFKHINRGNDIYAQTTSRFGGPDQVFKILDQTNENSIMMLFNGGRRINSQLKTNAQFGFEHAFHANFDSTQSLDNFLGKVSIELDF
jgi:hypothetical protein